MSEAVRRRCRPLLGTFVDITVTGGGDRALARAFALLESLRARLDAHDPRSELSRLNRRAHRSAVAVSADLWRVLRAAARLARLSDGAFDATLGAGAFSLLPGRRVRFSHALRLDLGGIAKGYCVDRAVATLRRAGATGGLVNAGGDLRAFGRTAFPLHLRHPGDAHRLVRFGALREAALATSASYGAGNSRRSARAGRDLAPRLSVSVRAPSAMLADALTKVVAARGAAAAPLLERLGARAWICAA